MRRALLLLPVLAGLAGCGYRPPSAAETRAPGYETDLQACRTASATDVDKRNAKTGLAWISSPVRRWGQIGDATGSCMQGKGWGQTRWCTADELRTGGGNQIVTSDGVECRDLPKR